MATDAAPALKTLFKLIGRYYLKKITTTYNYPLVVDWKIPEAQFEDEIYRGLAELQKNDQKAFAVLCTTLFNINAVCQDNRNGRYIIGQIKAAGMFGNAVKEWRTERPPLHKIVCFVFLQMPDLWDKLRRNALIKQVVGLGGQKQYIAPPANDIPEEVQKEAFESEFLSFMERETTMITHIHTEFEDFGTYIRYVFHVNPFPKEVEQFDKDGKFKLQLDQNAEGFTIVHHRGEAPFLRIKCAFSTYQRKEILKLFAKYMLATKTCDKPLEEYSLSSFNATYNRDFKMEIKSDDIASARVIGVSLEILNPENDFIDELSHKCRNGNLFERLEHSCRDFPVEWRQPIAWDFEITIVLDHKMVVQPRLDGTNEILKDKKTRTYSVHVTDNKLTIHNCQDDAHKALIIRLLADNGIKNVAKKAFITTTEYRK